MTGTGGPGPPALTARVESCDDSAETDPSVEVARQYSTEAPPLVSISVENVWTRIRRFHFEYTPPFGPRAGRDPDGTERTHLIPMGGRVPDEDGGWLGDGTWSDLVPDAREDDCWRVAGPYIRDRYEGGTVWSAAFVIDVER